MKTLAFLFFVDSCLAQDFVNINFDNPDLTASLRPIDPGNPRTPYWGNTGQLLRGWTLLADGVPLQEIAYQPGSGDRYEPVTLDRAADNFSLYIRSQPPNIVDLTFRQTGTVPMNAIGLSVVAYGRIDFLVNGELVGFSDSSAPLPTFDLSRFAGQTVTFDFHVRQNPAVGTSFFFDIAGFTQIPEPSTWALFGVGAAGLVWVEYRRRKS